MAIRNVLSLLAGMGAGAQDQTRYQDNKDRQARMDQVTLDRAQREGTEFDQAQQDRSALRAAGAPVTAAPDMVQGANGAPVQNMTPDPSTDSIDVGQPGTAPAQPTQRVGNQTGLAPTQVAGALDAANSPDAVRKRQMAVLNMQNPERAALLQARDLTAKNEQMDLAAKQFDSNLNAAAAKGLGSLVDFTNSSGTSPFQAKLVTSADGKVGEIHQVMPDGSLKPTGLSFTNDAKGAMEAATMLAKQVPVTAKLKVYSDERRMDLADKREDRQFDYQAGMLGVAQQNANTNERYRQDMVDQKRDAVAARTPVDRMPEADKLTYNAALKRQQKLDDLIDKAKADGTWDPKNPQMQALDTERLSQGVTVRQLEQRYSASSRNTDAPDPLGIRKPAGRGDGGGSEVSTTTRPATPMETIAQDMKANGITEAGATLAGQPKRMVLMAPGNVSKPQPAAAPPAPAPASAPAASAAPFQPNPSMEAQLQKEATEMSDPKVNRLKFSPPVAEYLRQKNAAADQQAETANAARSRGDFAKMQARNKAGYF